MDEGALQTRYLIVIAAFLCALIIGYNAFYVPEAINITVETDVLSSSQDEAYTPSPVFSTVSQEPQRGNGQSKVESPVGKVNINTATEEQLCELDGVGPVIAKRILDYRQKKGKFSSIEELKNVSGIGEKTFAKLKEHVTV
ncbi:MAG: ComE operon protein 1 [Eubacteriales bacterium]|jgi:competence protein ComEA